MLITGEDAIFINFSDQNQSISHGMSHFFTFSPLFGGLGANRMLIFSHEMAINHSLASYFSLNYGISPSKKRTNYLRWPQVTA